MRITTTWQALMKYAHAAGQARVAYLKDPTQENKLKLESAIKDHDQYRDLCLKADRMIGLEGVLN